MSVMDVSKLPLGMTLYLLACIQAKCLYLMRDCWDTLKCVDKGEVSLLIKYHAMKAYTVLN
jgi:hypothetical protein